MLYEIQGTYGSYNTPCTIFVYQDHRGLCWYCIEGSKNINATWDDLIDGVDTDLVRDNDCITAGEPINSLEELEMTVDL